MFYRIINLIFKVFVYISYRRKYNLPRDFRFNGFFIRFNGGGEVVCGSTCYISFFSYVNVPEGSRLLLGNNVSIGHNVKIYTAAMESEQFILEGIKKQVLSEVTIGNNVLIGANVFICPGVKIGDNVIVGANSVVSRDIPSGVIAGGAPAQIIRNYSK